MRNNEKGKKKHAVGIFCTNARNAGGVTRGGDYSSHLPDLIDAIGVVDLGGL